MIGIFDSGVGGLTVARAIMKELPEADLIYLGDTARAPYGNKSKETIVKYALQDADFLIKKGATMLVVACNTASALAYDELKTAYPNVPIFEVIAPAVDEAVAATKAGRIGVIGTRATIKSNIYEKRLKEKNGELFIESHECPLFVPFIEEGWLKSPELKMIARKYLSVFKSKNIDTLILGCTHYPLIKEIIQEKIGRRVKSIDSADAVAKKVSEFLLAHQALADKNKKREFYFSDVTEKCKTIANKFLGQNIQIYESGDFE
ncbi:MAG: glutamate racemase [Patescibacteria group bacterium]|jgi:glutamate racemase